jgi:MYXO-CTERM domain-containing protein
MASPTTFRTYLLAVTLSLGLGASFSARAQQGDAADGGSTFPADAGSAGEGGADRDNPEGEDSTGRVVVNCRSSNDCSPRFTCNHGKCHYSGIREADRVGCLLGPEAAIGLAGMGLVAAWRRRRS